MLLRIAKSTMLAGLLLLTGQTVNPGVSGGSSAGSAGAVQSSNGSGAFTDSGCTASGGGLTCPGNITTGTGSFVFGDGSGAYINSLGWHTTTFAAPMFNGPIGGTGATPNTGTFTAVQTPTVTSIGSSLVMKETGDTLGAINLALENRSGANGAVITNQALDLVDMDFVTSTAAQLNFRLEHRGSMLQNSANSSGEFQFVNPLGTIFSAYFGLAANGSKMPWFVPSLRSGSASNTDLAGQLTLSGGTATYTFTGTYTSAPICTANDNTAVASVKVVTTTTGLTLTGTTTDTVSYICVGRN